MANAQEYKSAVGVDSLYYALVTQDDSGGYVAGTPVYLAPTAEIKADPAVDRKTQYMDDQPYDALSVEGETSLKITIAGIPMDVLATITGRQFDVTTGRMYDNGGTPPYCAVGFRSMKSNGVYRYYWFLKGRFDMPGDEASTKSDKVDPKTKEVTFTAVRTIRTFSLPNSVTDSVKRVMGDGDTLNFSSTGWFSAVQYPNVGGFSALSMTAAVPTNGATSVVVSSTVTLTFNNALGIGEEFDCSMINNTSHAVIAGTNTIDGTRKIVTLGHTANMPAATNITIIYSVKDIYGQTLVGTSSFTTA